MYEHQPEQSFLNFLGRPNVINAQPNAGRKALKEAAKHLMPNCIVIGGSSGIGRQLLSQLSAAGWQVDATYNEHYLNTNDPNLRFHHLDVLDEDMSMNFIPASLDGLVYCPGTIKLKPFEKIKPKEFEDDYNLVLVGAVKVIQAVLPALKKSSQASIVLFSTVAASTGFNFHAQVAASKSAIEGLTRALAAEFAPHIRINCIAPSLTATPLSESLINTEQKAEANARRHPLKRIGSAQDIANMAEYLLSEKASWITGQVFHVDGGMSAINL